MLSFLQQVLEWFRKCAPPHVVAAVRVRTAPYMQVKDGSDNVCVAVEILTDGCAMQLVLQARNGARDDPVSYTHLTLPTKA